MTVALAVAVAGIFPLSPPPILEDGVILRPSMEYIEETKEQKEEEGAEEVEKGEVEAE